MIRSFAGEAAGVVLLCDTFTLHVISSCFKLSELLDENVQLIESITMKGPDGEYLRRQALPALTAVYFLTPTVESVNRLIADYRDEASDVRQLPPLLLVSPLRRAAEQAQGVARHRQGFGAQGLYLELVCPEANVFLLDSPESLPLSLRPRRAPAPPRPSCRSSIGSPACWRLSSRPLARCRSYATRATGRWRSRWRRSCIGSYRSSRATLAPPSPRASRPITSDPRCCCSTARATHSPLLHEFTYSAMCHDVLPVNNDRYRYQFVGNNNVTQTKEVLLNDTDPLWTRLKNMHIADLGTTLHAEFKAFVAEHPEAAGLTKQGGDKGLKTITEGLRHLPKFKERSERYSMHMALGQELMRKYGELSLEDVATLEQNMATGEDASGKAFKTALAELRQILERADLLLSPEDKMRLLMIYVITQDGIKQEERRELSRLADISPEDQVAILNLFYLQVTLLHGTSSRKRGVAKRDRVAGEGYDVSRYVPPLKRQMEELLTSGLPSADFPFVEPPSQHKGAIKGEASTGRRPIVFVLGGLTYSELRSMHELSRSLGREIIVGSTDMLTPQGFILALKEMKQLDAPSLV